MILSRKLDFAPWATATSFAINNWRCKIQLFSVFQYLSDFGDCSPCIPIEVRTPRDLRKVVIIIMINLLTKNVSKSAFIYKLLWIDYAFYKINNESLKRKYWSKPLKFGNFEKSLNPPEVQIGPVWSFTLKWHPIKSSSKWLWNNNFSYSFWHFWPFQKNSSNQFSFPLRL